MFSLNKCCRSEFPSNSTIQKDRKANGVLPLPMNRPRALTPPLDANKRLSKHHKLQQLFKKQVQQQTFMQEKSPLMCLPPEIRLMIWEFLLCNHYLHIVRAPRRLLAIRCDEEPNEQSFFGSYDHKCWGQSRVSIRRFPDLPSYYYGPKTGGRCGYANLLSIVKTCRLV